MASRARKGRLRSYSGDRGDGDTDVFGLPASIPGSQGTSGPNSFAGDLSDDDVWSGGASSYGACSVRDIPSILNEYLEDAPSGACVDKDKPRVTPARDRWMSAIDSEHIHILNQQLEMFLGDREELAASGKVVFDIDIRTDDPRSFTVTRNDGRSFRPAFKVNNYITIFYDHGKGGKKDDGSSSDSESVRSSSDTFEAAGNEGKGGFVGEVEASGTPNDDEGEEKPTSGTPPAAAAGGEADSVAAGDGDNGDDFASAPWKLHAGGLRPAAAAAAAGPSTTVVEAALRVQGRLSVLGVEKAFDACITKVTDRQIVVQTRYTEAAKIVEEASKDSAKSARWALSEAVQDIALRRQAAAAEALHFLFSPRPSSSSKATAGNKSSTPWDQELRFRQLLICNPDDADDYAFAHCASEAGVRWLDEEGQRELELVLSSMRLNEDQLGALKLAARRSVTLLQGPPGTGKTYTLAAMGAALCRVFHDPSGPSGALQDAGSRPDFELPSSKCSMTDWSEEEVTRWIRSFRDESLKFAALKGLKGLSGRAVQECKRRWLHSAMMVATQHGGEDSNGDEDDDDDDAAAGPPDAAAWDLARRRADAFLALRDATLAALRGRSEGSGAWASGYWRTAERDMRIIMCADTNTAANRLLESLVKLLPPGAPYDIVRLGVIKDAQKGTEGMSLASKYHVDNRRDQHPLTLVKERLRAALEVHAVNLQLGRDLQAAVQEFADKKLAEAQKSDRVLVRTKWMELAVLVSRDIAPKVMSVIKDHVSARRDATIRDAVKRNIRELQTELQEIALYDILIAAQVVVGTNTSIGEVRSICEKHKLSFPIVLMDEAGQASEPSCLIPLTLGAEWVLAGGDMAQLPPTILSAQARKVLGFYKPSGGSQYGRFLDLGVRELSLSLQYRMHPLIRNFPSVTFYQDRLREDPTSPPDTTLPQPSKYDSRGAFRWPSEERGRGPFPIAFLDVADGEQRQRGSSFYNLEEASLALQLLLSMATDPSVKSVVILTPYNGQVQYIGERLDKGKSVIARLRGRGNPLHYAVHTVDGFQGHEADVVIISTVLTGNSLRFLADERRLNVAITRARRALLIVGRAATLSSRTQPAVTAARTGNRSSHHDYWSRLLDHIKANHGFTSGQEVARLATFIAALPQEMACTPWDLKKIEMISTVNDYVAHAMEQRRAAKQQQPQEPPRQQQQQQLGQQPPLPPTPPKPPKPPKPPAQLTPKRSSQPGN